MTSRKPISPVDDNPARQSRRTPPLLVKWLAEEFGINFDVAATKRNAVFGPDRCFTRRDNAIADGKRWPKGWFCNPPWDNIAPFVDRAQRNEAGGRPGVLLLPVRADRLWWMDLMEDPGVTPVWINGRLRFIPENKSVKASSPSVITCLFFLGINPKVKFISASSFGGNDAKS